MSSSTKMVRRRLGMVALAIAQILFICTVIILPDCLALTYEELVMGPNPAIPEAVRLAGNVTVTPGSNGMVTITFSGLPNHGTMMVNNNDPKLRNFRVELPENPQSMAKETCLQGGPIGWTVHGVALFNPFNVYGTNAVDGEGAETFDSCQGHADMDGTYHYHQLPDACAFADFNANDVHGIALDGFPIYGRFKEDGSLVQEYELDKCHGRCGVDGKYRYHMTKQFPYILGCFRGTPVEYTRDGGIGGGEGGMGDGSEGGIMPPPDGDGMRPPPGEDGMRPPPGEDGMRPPPGEDGTRPPPGEDGTRLPPGEDSMRPDKCAFNEVVGPNYDFQTTCPNTPTDGSGGNGSGGDGSGGDWTGGDVSGGNGAAGHTDATVTLLGLTCIFACVMNVILIN